MTPARATLGFIWSLPIHDFVLGSFGEATVGEDVWYLVTVSDLFMPYRLTSYPEFAEAQATQFETKL